MVLIGNKFNETVPKTRPNGDKGNKRADFVPQENRVGAKKNNLYPKIKIAKVAEKINSKKLYL